MTGADKHVTQLVKSKYHDDGACVCRHESKRKPKCHYDKNGFNETRANRAHLYSSPTRFKASAADEVAQETRRVGSNKKKVRSPTWQANSPGRKKSIWNVGARADGVHENFTPRSLRGVGFHYPYFHEWHHMIANKMLVTHLLGKGKDKFKLLEVLMAGKYNINDERNIVLLPQQKSVGDIVRWPTHPNNHNEFDAYARDQLGKLRQRLLKALDDAGHPVNNATTTSIANDVHKASKNLLDILDKVGQAHGGVHVNLARALWNKLVAAGAT